MGLFDILRGKTAPIQPNLDALFALPSAGVTMETQAGLVTSGHAGVCWKPPAGQTPAEVETQVRALLDLDDADPTTPSLTSVEDSLGYRWLLVEGGSLDELATRIHQVNTLIVESGWGAQMLCSVFGLVPSSDADVTAKRLWLVYLYKRGTFYPFCPDGDSHRDNEAELRLRSVLGSDLPVESDLGRWMALWGLPVASAGRMRHAKKNRPSRSGLIRLALAWVVVAGLFGSAFVAHAVASKPPSINAIETHHDGRPLRMLLVGDSAAGTLGVGLAKSAPAANVDLINRAVGGCSLGIALLKGWLPGVPTRWPPPSPCNTEGLLAKELQSYLTKFNPDVVVYLSHLDTADMYPSATSPNVTHIGQPAYDAQLSASLTAAVDLLSSTGAKVMLGTSPPTLFAQKGDLNDDPARWAAYQVMLDRTAAQSNGKATVIDLTRFFGGTGPVPKMQLYSPSGVQWRCGDGIHFDTAGGEFFAPTLFNKAWQLAGPRMATTQSEPPLPSSIVNKTWPSYVKNAAVMNCPN